MGVRHILQAAFLALVAPGAAFGQPALQLLNPLFSDHAVLQRDQPIRIWGHAAPGESVTVSLGHDRATARANTNGRWQVTLRPLSAGGPYMLSAVAASGARQSVNDVLIGDVWLCSGQSNMVLQVRRTLDSDSEIANSANDSIRMLTVPDTASPVPLETIAPAPWQSASPATTGEFSATCFYFARELQKAVHVPLGLVVSAWGGSKIRTWIGALALRDVGGFDRELDILNLYARDSHAATQAFGAIWENWWNAHVPGPTPWNPATDVRNWPLAPAKLGEWDDWGIPALVNRTGMVWYRTSVNLTAAQAAQSATLTLGATDDLDAAWVNGKPAGAGGGGDRIYALPAGMLHAGENVIAVNILNTYMRGGFIGPPEKQGLHFADGTSVPLGRWRYSIVPQSVGDPPRAPWEPLAGYSVAYNGMIAPQAPYNFRGVVWYQGESDTGDWQKYPAELAGLMAEWRRDFQANLPFLIVQLPGYGKPPTHPGESGWAEVREVERAVVARDGNAALAVTVDIGNPYDVHPANKQEVGRRLARAARHLVYGEKIVPGGPIAQSVSPSPEGIVVRFADAEGGFVTYSSNMPIGFELCGAAPSPCQYSTAQIRGDTVLLPANASATRVRYCWADSPICTLFDGAGLPAAPFDLPIGGPR